MKDNKHRNERSYHKKNASAKHNMNKRDGGKKRSRYAHKKGKVAENTAVISTSTPGLPVTHPCYNCPLARMYGDVLFCYTPGCMRKVMNDIVAHRKAADADEE